MKNNLLSKIFLLTAIIAFLIYGDFCAGIENNQSMGKSPDDMEISSPMPMNTVIIENEFVATGVIIDIMDIKNGINKIIMNIEKAEQLGDFPNFGTDYIGKSVEIFSEIGIPHSVKIGEKAALVCKVSGDEKGQKLYLKGVFSDE
jgi:hypothetical protein